MRPRVTVLACEVCGRLPHPGRTRLTLAKLAAVFPVELAVHALVVHLHPPYLLTVALLTITTTILVIWVVEPSAMRMLGGWLHSPELRTRDRIDAAPALWRIRVRLADRPGALETLAKHLARDANILTVHVHELEDAVLDELVVAAPAEITAQVITIAVGRGRFGGAGVACDGAVADRRADQSARDRRPHRRRSGRTAPGRRRTTRRALLAPGTAEGPNRRAPCWNWTATTVAGVSCARTNRSPPRRAPARIGSPIWRRSPRGGGDELPSRGW